MMSSTATHAGQLKVTVMEARQLIGKGGMKIDPFCVLSIKHGSGGALAALIGAKEKTQVIKNNVNPLWNETHYLTVKDPQLDLLTIKLKDKSLLKSSLIGTVDIPIRDFLNGAPRDLWVNLTPASSGSIHLMLQFNASHATATTGAPLAHGTTTTYTTTSAPGTTAFTQAPTQFSEKSTTTTTHTTESYLPRP